MVYQYGSRKQREAEKADLRMNATGKFDKLFDNGAILKSEDHVSDFYYN